jgi:hypothetical protein
VVPASCSSPPWRGFVLARTGRQVELFARQAPVTVNNFQRNLTGAGEALMADASQWWKDKIREASMRKRTAIAAAGYITAGNVPPFGFRWKEDNTHLTRRGHPLKTGLEPDLVTAPALLHMTEHIANGGTTRALKGWLEANHLYSGAEAPAFGHGVSAVSSLEW